MSRPGSACPVPGCLEVLPCPEHAKVQPQSDPFYRSVAWRRLSTRVLVEHPTCVQCGGASQVIDHIEPRPHGAPLDRSAWDRDENLQALCRRDHGRKTAKHDGAFGNPKRPLERRPA